jgi:hypothetical protein
MTAQGVNPANGSRLDLTADTFGDIHVFHANFSPAGVLQMVVTAMPHVRQAARKDAPHRLSVSVSWECAA